MANIDTSVTYAGPRADFASLTGSPFWGLSIDEVVSRIKRRGWTHNSGARILTPYGMGPLVHHFTTPSGRDVIWIPAYGVIEGEKMFGPVQIHKAYWLLWQAGVRVLLIGGTSGTNDWRDPAGEATVRPGDFIVPWSFYPDRDMPGTLPGTEMATGYLPNFAFLKDPFCLTLGRILADKARAELAPHPFPRVHEPSQVKVSLRNPYLGTFETEFETAVWRTTTRLVSEDEAFPHVMIHGDCISPVLARRMGIHLGYYHIAVNWVEGHPATQEAITDTLDRLYLDVLPQVCLEMELDLLATLDVPVDCTCAENLVERPAIYMEAITRAR